MSAQATSAKKVANYTQAISANVANLVAELARANTQNAAPPPTPNINDEVLQRLESITSDLARIHSDLDLLKRRGDPAREEVRPDLVDLLELESEDLFHFHTETAEEHNELARRYNSELRFHGDFIAPLHNARNKPVFGFPTTLGELANFYQSKALEFVCSAFGLADDLHALHSFCGVQRELMSSICLYQITGNQQATFRVKCRRKRERDIEAAGAPTTSTRLAAERHNVKARSHNAEADCSDYDLMPIHDERNLPVPGFPTDFQSLLRPHRRDILYLLGEYGLDTKREGCLERFEEFVGLRGLNKTEIEAEWFL
ncbi:hypothetical protein DFP73DRAFT_560898 [Morchella snyderi]|nr:hypothetical protein DFP73DRAFT_560898 [Morchella snyderi]